MGIGIRNSLKRFRLTFCFIVVCLALWCIWILPGILSAESIQADRIVIVKSKRILLLFKEGEILRAYVIALGQQPDGHKTAAGDKKTPEGTYRIDSRNARSKFHKSLHISYPNRRDVRTARKLGIAPGGGIMIHGLTEDMKEIAELHRFMDWTDGCIAVTNEEIDEIWELVPVGTPIEIKP
jgi:murein L,D-transpeptidase YafK